MMISTSLFKGKKVLCLDNKNIAESSGDMIYGYDYNDQNYYKFENDENENEAEDSESPFDEIFSVVVQSRKI
ncbi:hypothetical protein RIR_jg24443.t1 [Rhizophagus irregularis DAOM 181602=DAOM 197198]|nr:hypothetical protein RIR_jg24443.t1 [Rhizophagus irregularis DAOM 181602=DAOM 197198]